MEQEKLLLFAQQLERLTLKSLRSAERGLLNWGEADALREAYAKELLLAAHHVFPDTEGLCNYLEALRPLPAWKEEQGVGERCSRAEQTDWV